MSPFHALVLAGALVGTQPPESPTGVPSLNETIAVLAESLHDSDAQVRQHAASALANIGPPAVTTLQRALMDKDPNARAAAAYAFGYLGTDARPAKRQLLDALKDEDREVRRQVAYALSRITAEERLAGTNNAGPSAEPPPPVFPPEKP